MVNGTLYLWILHSLWETKASKPKQTRLPEVARKEAETGDWREGSVLRAPTPLPEHQSLSSYQMKLDDQARAKHQYHIKEEIIDGWVPQNLLDGPREKMMWSCPRSMSKSHIRLAAPFSEGRSWVWGSEVPSLALHQVNCHTKWISSLLTLGQ